MPSYRRCLLVAAAVAPVLLLGCEGPEPETEQVIERRKPALRSVRGGAVAREPLEKPEEKLSEHALAFYKELAEIARTGEAPTPRVEPLSEDARAAVRAVYSKGLRYQFQKGGARSSAGPRIVYSMGAWSTAGPPPGMPVAEAKKLGVTTGGMQDIGLARRLIKEGKVPSPSAFTAEGLISEHDIPVEGMPSGEDLYASASVAWTRRFGKRSPEAIVLIGFGVDMDLAEFRRPPLNLGVVVDVSGSMRGGKIEAVKKALLKLVDRLGEKDRLAIVLFHHQAWVPLPSAFPADREKAREIVKGLKAGGSTNIEDGLRHGFAQVAAHLKEEERSPRVLLFTDARPNVNATAPHGFLPMTEGAAAAGIGLGAFGVGMDFGQDLAYKIFRTRGANYFYLENEEKIARVFDEEFDFLVTPAAYDIELMLVPEEKARITDVLGVPDYKEDAEGAEMKIPTLFFSKREGGGAVMVALALDDPDFADEVPLAVLDLSFVPVGSKERIRQRLEVFLPPGCDPEGEPPYFSQEGARKALVLADIATALKAATSGFKTSGPEVAKWRKTQEAPPAREPSFTAEEARKAARALGGFCDWLA